MVCLILDETDRRRFIDRVDFFFKMSCCFRGDAFVAVSSQWIS